MQGPGNALECRRYSWVKSEVSCSGKSAYLIGSCVRYGLRQPSGMDEEYQILK